MQLKHFTPTYLKGHYALAPLFGVLGFAMVGAATYLARITSLNPDVMWRRKTNPEPWQHQVTADGKTRRYKFWQASADFHAGQTKYGLPAFNDERPPIEKLWAEYQAEHATSAGHH